MRLSSRQVRAAYELLRTLPPYCRWGLPKPEQIRFAVSNRKGEYGRYEYDGCAHSIEISRRNVKNLHALTITMAHEVLHLRQQLAGTSSDRYQHNRDFMRLAKHVCRVLGFDSKGFK